MFLVGICIVAGLGFFSDTWTSFLVLREKVRARMKEQEDATTETATNAETVTPADASPADAPPVAESKASEPTVGADSSGGVSGRRSRACGCLLVSYRTLARAGRVWGDSVQQSERID